MYCLAAILIANDLAVHVDGVHPWHASYTAIVYVYHGADITIIAIEHTAFVCIYALRWSKLDTSLVLCHHLLIVY